MTVHNHGWLQKVSNDRLFSLNLTFLNFSQYPHIYYILYVFLLNKLTFLPRISSLCLPPYYRKWVFLVDSKCRNTVILTGLIHPGIRVFHDGCAKRGTLFHQILNKNSLSLAHCALNRSFTVYTHIPNLKGLTKIFFKLSHLKGNLCIGDSVIVMNPKYP